MKKIGDFALVAIAVILLVGLSLFKDYNRYEIETEQRIVYLLDKRTGEVWVSRANTFNDTELFHKFEHFDSN